jgi:hypothetical protein
MYFRFNDITLCVSLERTKKSVKSNFSVEGSQRVVEADLFLGGRSVSVSLFYHILYFLGGIGWGNWGCTRQYSYSRWCRRCPLFFRRWEYLKQMKKSCIALLLFGVVFRHCSFLCYFTLSYSLTQPLLHNLCHLLCFCSCHCLTGISVFNPHVTPTTTSNIIITNTHQQQRHHHHHQQRNGIHYTSTSTPSIER